ncbi:fibrinogen-like protein 1 isoform X3 [Gadus macrocephalus]|uniref:fibrinogen-like protein 1 isoform X3 n=1 Tax=Gadus macrocephalus TaxID=80720 RepID=UPI0028CB4028|nr:fibrinogen-like protein 1 isoform X3 [Gadus macrocephalus]
MPHRRSDADGSCSPSSGSRSSQLCRGAAPASGAGEVPEVPSAETGGSPEQAAVAVPKGPPSQRLRRCVHLWFQIQRSLRNPAIGQPGAGASLYCDMSDGGGWTVVQRRIDGSELFNRSWTEYKNGFGDKSGAGEFWFGNENLHYLTDQGNYSVRIILGDFEGSQSYAEYNNFRLGPEQSDYRLSFGAYSGTAGDALSGNYQVGVSGWASHQGAKFSTYDRDNDNYAGGKCAQEDKGGWWFNRCHSAHLNGLYYPSGPYSAVTDDGVVWVTWRGWWYSLKTTVMKLRPADFKEDPLSDLNYV